MPVLHEIDLDVAIYNRLEFRFSPGCDCGRPNCDTDTWYATLPGTPFKAIGASKEHAADRITAEVSTHIKCQQVLYQIWQESKVDPNQTIWDLLKEDNG